jgi:hypothetical protein
MIMDDSPAFRQAFENQRESAVRPVVTLVSAA